MACQILNLKNIVCRQQLSGMEHVLQASVTRVTKIKKHFFMFLKIEVRVPESTYKYAESKAMTFLHRNYIPTFFQLRKQKYFFDVKKKLVRF